MNILFISRAYGEHAGGMERLSYELIESFPEATRIVNQTTQDHNLWLTRLKSIVFMITILPKALIAAKDSDIVHIGDPVLSFVGWCIARVYKTPIVVTVHGLDLSYSNPVYQLYLKLFFRSFTHYIAISEYAKKLLQMQRVQGRISVIPPGVRDDLITDHYTRNDLGKLLYRNVANRIIFVTTGRLVARKGHQWFIKNVMTRLPRTALYAIAGDGPELNRITALIKSLKIEDRVVMLGRVSHADKKILFNTADACIQPNIPIIRDAEGFGIAPIEAALCERRVFASNIDGIPSAIHNGKNGTLLPPKETTAWVNALMKFMEHPLSQEPSGRQARAYTLAMFSWEIIAKKYQDVFTSVLK